MAFLDKIKQQAEAVANAAGTVAQTAVQQTKTLAGIGRIKLAIATEEDKVKKAYGELGRLYYRDYEAQTEPAQEDYQPWCDKVADAKEQIARLYQELEKLRAAEEGEGTAPAGEEPAMIQVDLTATAAEEAPAEEEAPQEEAPTEETPTEEAPAEEAQEPTVDTLYVDVTETEE